jgi:hypothetical protein
VAAAVAVLLAPPAAAPIDAAPRIGQKVGPLVFHDLRGRRYTEPRVRTGKAAVFVFLSTQCPVSKRYGTRLFELARTYGPRGVRWFVVNANRDESAAEVARDAAERERCGLPSRGSSRRPDDSRGCRAGSPGRGPLSRSHR